LVRRGGGVSEPRAAGAPSAAVQTLAEFAYHRWYGADGGRAGLARRVVEVLEAITDAVTHSGTRRCFGCTAMCVEAGASLFHAYHVFRRLRSE
jgi:hypothetical protein